MVLIDKIRERINSNRFPEGRRIARGSTFLDLRVPSRPNGVDYIMCKHNYAKIHPEDDCIICFHAIFDVMTRDEVIKMYNEVNAK